MNRSFRRLLMGGLMLIGALASELALAQMHGDHNPHHGGVVLMYGSDLHYEVVLTPQGTVQLFLSDAMRGDLPAALVSEVAVEIERAGKREAVDMKIDDSGEYWLGQSKPVKEEGTLLHLAFVFREEAVVLQFPASALMGAGREQLIKDSTHAQ